MAQVLSAVQARIQYEQSDGFPSMRHKWMLDYLKHHNWIIPRDEVPAIVSKLKLTPHKDKTTLYKYYYTKLVVWMPHLQYDTMPCCINCNNNKNVGFHGFPQHPGRMIVDLEENYYIMGCRYKCNDCKKQKERLKTLAKEAVAAAAAGVEVEVTKVNLQTTFMGWDSRILPLFPDGIGKEFPAFLTKRAGVDMTIVDMIRPLFDKSIRPESFSDLLLELHTKEWTRRYIRYERDIARRDRLFPGYAKQAPLFSDFSDKEFFNGRVPTGKYIQLVYTLFHDTISEHLAREVKKRPVDDILYWDVSYKINKRMNRYKGERIFKGLVTGMNPRGEIRIQFHIFTDSHEQMTSALEAFKDTNKKLGMEGPRYFVTDNPKADAAFVKTIFDTLRQQQQRLDENLVVASDTPSFDDEFYKEDRVKVVSLQEPRGAEKTNVAISAMWDVAKGKVIGLDAEWSVTKNRYGRVTKSGKVALIQMCYVDNKNEMRTLLVRTHGASKLPHRLVSLLTGSTFTFVGVNVSGDLIKIGKDFDIEGINQVTQKERDNVINLGLFARERDIVQDGSVSLPELCKRVTTMRLNKPTNIRLSDWDRREDLTKDQIKYAAVDAIASLKIYLQIKDMPDLTKRYTMSDVSAGNIVDLVPNHGSVACMATRAATGIIVHVRRCESPNDVTPRFVRAGEETVAIKLVKIYSPGFKVPEYKYQPPDSQGSPATLSHFKEDCIIVVPVHMLKQHVPSDKVRSTPTDTSHSSVPSVTSPARVPVPPSAQEVTMSGEAAGNSLEENDEDNTVEVVMDSLTEDHFSLDTDTVTQNEIEWIRAAAEQTKSTTPANLFPCEGLSPSPSPTDIVDKFSCVLGDAFHAMKRCITPTTHEGKKAFFVALRNAFFVWNKDKLEELMSHMREEGLSQEEIDNKMLFSPKLFTDCVDRRIPPPSLLYFRVRAVFVLFGKMVDSESKKPLFNKRAWKSANNVLSEILSGYYSDPPGVQWYTKRLKKDGSVATNKYGMEMLDCSRGTNRVESFHKDLISSWGSWPMGMEMSSKLLAEKRHRHNHRVSEKRRHGFPKISALGAPDRCKRSEVD